MATGLESKFQMRLMRALVKDGCIVHKIPGGMFLKDEPDLRVCSTKYDTVRFVELKALAEDPCSRVVPTTLTREQHSRLLTLTPDECYNFGGLLATEYSLVRGDGYLVHILLPGYPAMAQGKSYLFERGFSRNGYPLLEPDLGEAWFTYTNADADQILRENAWVFQFPWWGRCIPADKHLTMVRY